MFLCFRIEPLRLRSLTCRRGVRSCSVGRVVMFVDTVAPYMKAPTMDVVVASVAVVIISVSRLSSRL